MLYKDEETQADGAAPQHPARLGEFRIERELGRGGMGVVYVAEQERLGRRVALKVLALTATPSPVAAERFLREAALVARLEHENIVRVYAMGQEQGCLFYAMELVEGESLRDRIARGALAPREAVEIARAVALALDCAHRAGIIHRDVKPANVLLDRSGVAHLADFGLAHGEDSSSLTLSGDVLGTPAYMSPEQAEARKDIDARADVYALGAVLYEALAGTPPCGLHTDLFAQLEAVRVVDPIPPSRKNGRVPRDLDVIVLRCLEKERERRYASAAAVAEDLDRFLRGEAIHARPPSVAWRVKRFVRRHWTAAGVAALFVIASVGAVVFWATRPGHLTLRVQPPDAWVRIDGAAPVRAAAVDRLPLDAGTHAIAVARSGYVSVEFPYAVAHAESAVVPVNLERIRERVHIATDPPDCSVWFHPGEGTPFRRLSDVDEEIATDEYEVVVEKEGRHRERLRFRLQAGEAADLRVTLAPAVLWSARFPQPGTPLSAPLAPGGEPVIGVVCQSGEVEFFRGRDGASLGKSQAAGQLPEPLLVDVEPDGSPELLTWEPAGALRLARWGTGQEVWFQAAPRVGRLGPFPVLFRSSGDAAPELWIPYDQALECIDLRTGGDVGQCAAEPPFYQTVLSETPRRRVVQQLQSLLVIEGLDREVERIETPPVLWNRLFLCTLDLDGDGSREVLVRYGDGSIRAWRTGPLAPLWQTPPNELAPGLVAAGSLRAGEAPCVVAMVDAHVVEIREADGRRRASWTLSDPPRRAFVLADMNADGARDLVYLSATALQVIDLGTERVLADVPFARPLSDRLALADVNRDGLLDAAVSVSDGAMQVVPGRKVLWSWQAGHSVRRPPTLLDVTADGTLDLVFSSLDGNAYALEGRTGRLLWKAPLGGQAATRPAAAGQDVVAASWGGRAVRLRGRTGEEAWRYAPTVEGWDVHFHASPTVADIDADGRLEILLADWRTDPTEKRDPSGALHCLDAESGQVRWVKELSAPFASAPASPGGGEVVCGDTDGNLVCLAADGSVRWQEAHGGQFRADPRPAPGEPGAMVWIVSGTGEVRETRPGQPGSRPCPGIPRTVHVAWGTLAGKRIGIAAARKDVLVLDAAGATLWRFQAPATVMAPPLAVDLENDGAPEVFVADEDGHVSCLEGASGEVRWTWEGGSSIEAAPIAADLDGDGRVELIVATQDGRVVVLTTRGRRWSGEWISGWGDLSRTGAPDSVGPSR